jgi:hypothetical protein
MSSLNLPLAKQINGTAFTSSPEKWSAFSAIPLAVPLNPIASGPVAGLLRQLCPGVDVATLSIQSCGQPGVLEMNDATLNTVTVKQTRFSPPSAFVLEYSPAGSLETVTHKLTGPLRAEMTAAIEEARLRCQDADLAKRAGVVLLGLSDPRVA